jgi:cation transport ATPase
VGCVRAVNGTASRLDGVEKTEVDFATKTLTITMKAGQTLEQATLAKALEGTRFSVKSFVAEQAEPEKKEEAAAMYEAVVDGMT